MAAGAHSRAPFRGKATAQSFVRSLAFKQRLRICNAYPYDSALEVYVAGKKVTATPMAYKSCDEFLPELHVEDEIDFKVAGTNAGTFTISDLPSSDAVLLMVVYRHNTLSTAVAFESHVFADLASSQVAVMDTYRGTQRAELRIQDAAESGVTHPPRIELLRYDNVVAVDSGAYEVSLRDAGSSTTTARAELVALPKEAYVVLRCGVDAQVGRSYPQELVVYPRSERAQLGAAPRPGPSWAALALLLAAAAA